MPNHKQREKRRGFNPRSKSARDNPSQTRFHVASTRGSPALQPPRALSHRPASAIASWLTHYPAVLPCGAFVLTRLAYVLDVATSDEVLSHLVVLDAKRFVAMAQRIAEGDLFAGNEPFAFGPLYGYVLAVFFALGLSHWAAYALQVACSGLTTWLVYRMGKMAYGRAGGSLGATAWALYPASAMLELTLMPTILATSLLVASVYLTLAAAGRRLRFGVLAAGAGSSGLRSWALAGGALGGAVLTSPNLLLCGVALYAWLAWRWWHCSGKRMLASLTPPAIHAASCTVVVATAAFRNLYVSGGLVFLTAHGGLTFYHGNNERAIGSYATPPGLSGDPAAQIADSVRVAQEHAGAKLASADVDAYFWQVGIDFLSSDLPGAFLLWAKKLAMWFGSDEISMEFLLAGHRELFPSLWLMPVPFAVIAGAAVLGFWARPRLRLGLIVAIGVASLATTLVFFFASRYRSPVVPLLCVLAGGGLVQVLRCAVSVRRGMVAGVLTLASLTSWCGLNEAQRAAYYLMVGNEYFDHKLYGAAAGLFRKALLVRPHQWRPRHNLGEAYGMMGRWREAVTEFERAQEVEAGHVSTKKALLHYRGLLERNTRLAE